jgi:hypothetical protein
MSLPGIENSLAIATQYRRCFTFAQSRKSLLMGNSGGNSCQDTARKGSDLPGRARA